jgi:hypothetical protein
VGDQAGESEAERFRGLAMTTAPELFVREVVDGLPT